MGTNGVLWGVSLPDSMHFYGVFHCSIVCTSMGCFIAGKSALMWGVSVLDGLHFVWCFIARQSALLWNISLPDSLHSYGVFHCRIVCTSMGCFVAG